MKNSLKDLTVNVKKSIDREYDGEFNLDSKLDDIKKMVDDNVISSIEDSYDDYDVVIEPDDSDVIEINPGPNIDTIRLLKVKSITSLSEELDNVTQTRVPAIIDLKYMQERRASDFRRLPKIIKEYKEKTNSQVVLLGSTKNVIVVVPEDIILLR